MSSQTVTGCRRTRWKNPRAPRPRRFGKQAEFSPVTNTTTPPAARPGMPGRPPGATEPDHRAAAAAPTGGGAAPAPPPPSPRAARSPAGAPRPAAGPPPHLGSARLRPPDTDVRRHRPFRSGRSAGRAAGEGGGAARTPPLIRAARPRPRSVRRAAHRGKRALRTSPRGRPCPALPCRAGCGGTGRGHPEPLGAAPQGCGFLLGGTGGKARKERGSERGQIGNGSEPQGRQGMEATPGGLPAGDRS